MRQKLIFSFSMACLVISVLPLASCSQGSVSSPIVSSTFTETPTGAATGKVTNHAAAASADKIFAANSLGNGASAEKSEYRIGPLDVLEVSVYGVKDLSKTVQVSSAGTISLPLVKTVNAAGQTPQQLEQAIANKLSANYMQSPQVSVFVKEYNSQRITVDGEVNKPGIYPISGKTTLMQAIAMAQGLNLVADPRGVLVFRNADNRHLAGRFDLRQVRAGRTPDPQLQAGDIVMVDTSEGRAALRDIKEVVPLTGLFTWLAL